MNTKLSRVLRMPLPEMAGRGRQEAAKWLDRLGMLPVSAVRPGVPSRRISPPDPNHFFAGAAEAARGRMPLPDTLERDRIVAAADAICGGRFDLLGYAGLDFGEPVDWHLDPVSGHRAPLVHWSRIDPLDHAAVGDSKVIWELNRHQWLLHLGQAYRFTGNERYAEVAARHVWEWMGANPPGIGINWASSLEAAFRLIAWSWVLVLLEGSRALFAPLREAMIRGIGVHARRIARYPSLYFAPNTHLTGEALGLFYAGVLFPDLPGARQWRTAGEEILTEQCARHILSDGVYFERATCYQRYTAEFYLHFFILASRNGIALPHEVADRLLRLLDVLAAVRLPGGTMPLIGDADGGWLLPLVPRQAADTRGVFAAAAALFGRADYAWAAGGSAPETFWLLGPAGTDAFAALRPSPPQGPPSRWYPEGGYAVMRDGWGPGAHQMIVDAGPTDPRSGSHWHTDLLGVQCAVAGEPCIVDPGISTYADPAWREHFRSAAAHSTVRVDGTEHVRRSGPFRFDPHPLGRDRRWISCASHDLVDGRQELRGAGGEPVIHRRRVVFVKPRCWVLVDDLHGAGGGHRVELCFQFAPLEVTVEPDRWVRVRGRSRSGLLLHPFAPVPLSAELYEGTDAPPRGWVAGDYGRRIAAPALVYAAWTGLPLRIATLLLPVRDPEDPLPDVSALWSPAGEIAGIALDGGTEIRFTDDDILVRDAHHR